MIDLNIDPIRTDLGTDLSRIAHRCGCYAWWDRIDDGTWHTAPDSFRWVCPDHRDELRGVPCPTFPARGDTPAGGYPWVAT